MASDTTSIDRRWGIESNSLGRQHKDTVISIEVVMKRKLIAISFVLLHEEKKNKTR